jgi:hypothetical protein
MLMSRRVLIAAFAALSELVIIAAAGNQAITKFIIDHQANSPLLRDIQRGLVSVSWRFTPQSGARASWLGALVGDVVLVVVTFLLVLALLRGKASFSGAFFATLTSVVTATVLGAMVAVAIAYDDFGRQQHTGLGRIGFAVFNSVDGPVVVMGLASGIVAGILTGVVAAILAAALRNRPTLEPVPATGSFAPGLTPSPYSNTTEESQPWGAPYPDTASTDTASTDTAAADAAPVEVPDPAGYQPTAQLPEVPAADEERR